MQVFYGGEWPSCLYQDLGIVEATSGGGFSMGSFQSSTAPLQREAAKRGATGVIVLDHGKMGALDAVTGKAIRCYAPMPMAFPPPYAAPYYPPPYAAPYYPPPGAAVPPQTPGTAPSQPAPALPSQATPAPTL